MSKKTIAPVPAPEPAAPCDATSAGDPTEGLTGVPLALAQALLDEPGGAAALLALAAGTSRPTASRVLVAMEAQGLVRRESGERGEGNGRRPDRWYLTAAPAPDPAAERSSAGEPALGNPTEEGDCVASRDEEPEEPADPEGEVPERVSQEEAAGPAADGTAPQTDEAAGPGGDQTGADAGDATADGEEACEPGSGREAEAQVPASPDSQVEAVSGPGSGGQGGQGDGAPLASHDVAATPPAAGRVAVPGQPCPTCGHRGRPAVSRAVSGGGTRLGQGQLHDLALEHLRAYPDQEWTATGIAKEIGRSSGAIANALATMASRGQAEMTCAAPRRYRATAVATGSGGE
jgi:hypothetical protein